MRKTQLTLACLLWLIASATATLAEESEWKKNEQLGRFALASGNLSAADNYLQQAIQSAQHLYGPNYAPLRALMHDLIDAYIQGQKYPQAEAIFQRVLSLYKQDLGDSPDTADQMVKLAQVYVLDGKTAAAMTLYEQALSIYERFHNANKDLFNGSIASVLDSLGCLYVGQGKFSEAEPLFKRALSIRESVFGPDSLEVASTLQNYAGLLRKTNRADQADQMSNRAKAISSHGP